MLELNKKLSWFEWSLVVLIVFLVFAGSFYIKSLKDERDQLLISFKQDLFRSDLQFVKEDIEMYGYISKRVNKDFIGSIEKASKEYSIPVGMLHSIFRVESDYRWMINHPKIFVKGKETNAIGLGGVVWEYWSDKLINKKIAENRNDLYIPEVNIEAAAYILRYIINEEIHKPGADLLGRIITRYYGAYSELYKDKTIKITSELWMKKMIRDIKLIGFVKIK
ncbi:MAG TPA: transglycosylase SLT domain-containing protein [Candidatus Nanoarchaeia archaeon]|nr:transglycosylase SLT domain-containing protein [Candidatus Nanoarchaeia archaeon]